MCIGLAEARFPNKPLDQLTGLKVTEPSSLSGGIIGESLNFAVPFLSRIFQSLILNLLMSLSPMSDSENSEQWAVSVAHSLYTATAKFLPDTTTFGEIRVLTFIAHAAVNGTAVTTKEISDGTGIPPYGISRVVSRYLEIGTLEERPHPSDGRSKQICFNEEAHDLNSQWATQLRLAFKSNGLL